MTGDRDDDNLEENAADTVVVDPRRHLIRAPRPRMKRERLEGESDPAPVEEGAFVVPEVAEASLLQTRLREHHRAQKSGVRAEKNKKNFPRDDLGSLHWVRLEARGLKIRRVENNAALVCGRVDHDGGTLALGIDSKRYTVNVAPHANAAEVALSVQNRLQSDFDVELAEGVEGVLLTVRNRGEWGWSS